MGLGTSADFFQIVNGQFLTGSILHLNPSHQLLERKRGQRLRHCETQSKRAHGAVGWAIIPNSGFTSYLTDAPANRLHDGVEHRIRNRGNPARDRAPVQELIDSAKWSGR